jgi:putative transcriptional regulator
MFLPNLTILQADIFKMNRIKDVIAEKGVKQTWIASKIGKSYNMVNSYVHNRHQPRANVLKDIATLLNVDANDLLVTTKKSSRKK